MKNEALMLPHPIERLKLYELDMSKLDGLNLPELFLVEDSMLTPYMPAFMSVKVIEHLRVETLDSGECRFFFRLNREVNDPWLTFFESYRNGAKVIFQGDLLILCCEPQELPTRYDEICNDAIYLATGDYCKERLLLHWQVFEKMKDQERRDHLEAEIQIEREQYQQKRRERMLFAESNGWSVPFFIRNLNMHYQGMLDSKFKYWSRVLDAATIRKYRALFAFDLLV